MKINPQKIMKKVETTLSPSLQKGIDKISKMSAYAGIKGHGELPKIMGILNFGDSGHTGPNTEKGSSIRKEIKRSKRKGESNPSEIVARPWLSDSTKGMYLHRIKGYINSNGKRLIASIPKRGQGGFSKTSSRSINPDDFMSGLANVMADNAKDNWEDGYFKSNAPSTLEKKAPVNKPLHGKSGEMSADKIEGWT